MMGTTKAVFIVFILFGLSYQQNSGCSTDINSVNSGCLSKFNVKDPSDSNFCSNAFNLSQCLDASCLDPTYRDAIHSFVPQLFRPGSCPICSTVPDAVTEARKTCTVWGMYHVIDFDSNVVQCSHKQSNILLTNEYFTITALSNITDSGNLYRGITAIRLDYHGCAVYSRTWSFYDWQRFPDEFTQGWFPHLITKVAQYNEYATPKSYATYVLKINLLAVNTDIIMRRSGMYMSISIRTGLADVSEGICTRNNTACVAESLVPGYPTNVTSYPCRQPAAQFQLACQYDSENTSFTNSDLIQISKLASVSLSEISALSDSYSFTAIHAREFQMPIALTVASSGLLITTFILALIICCGLREHFCSRVAHTLLFFGWIFFVLNAHILGFIYPFTGLTFVSFGLNSVVLPVFWQWGDFTGNNKRAFVTFSFICLPQQLCVAIIGVVANEWYLYEVQFWMGIACLVFMLVQGGLLVNANLKVAKICPKRKKPKREEKKIVVSNTIAMETPTKKIAEEPVKTIDSSESSESSSSSSSSLDKNKINVDTEPQCVVKPTEVIEVPSQDHVIEPPRQDHVIQPQSSKNDSTSEVPPPPKDGGAFVSPSPMDAYQTQSKYTFDSSSVDPARHMLRRAIKLSGVDIDSAKEAQIYAKMMELMQTFNLTGAINRDDGETAILRNNLATDLSEEIKLYRNDSLDELSYGFKEAILLWKEHNHL